MTETWLFLGATGRIGRLVRAHWAEAPVAGVTVVAQSRRAGAGLLQWDPFDAEVPVRADVILGFAGIVPRNGAEVGRNVDLGLAAVAMAERVGARRVLLASSSAVYGPGSALDEDSPCNPVNAYGEAKLEMERAVAGAAVEVSCLRIGNVAWADALLGAMQPGREVVLDRFSDGDGPRRSYIGPRSLARVLASLALCPDPLPAVLNLAAPEPVGMAALLQAAGVPWRWQEAPPTAVQDVTLDCRRLAAIHAFAPDAADPATLVGEGRGLLDAGS